MIRLTLAAWLAVALAGSGLPQALAQGPNQGSAEVPGFDDPELDARYRDLIHEIRCMNCQNQSVAESPAEQAGDIRRLVYNMMNEGQSDSAILEYLMSRYGDFISYKPPFKPSTWLLWTAPALLLIGGGLIFARILGARMRQPLDEELE